MQGREKAHKISSSIKSQKAKPDHYLRGKRGEGKTREVLQRQRETVETGQEDRSMALVPDEAGKLARLAGDSAIIPQGVSKHSES